MRLPGFRSRLGSLYVFGLVFVGLSFLLRTALLVYSIHSVDSTPWAMAEMYGVGLFFDLVTLFYMIVPAIVVLLLAPDRMFRSRVFRYFAYGVYLIMIYALLFDVAAEWLFWDEFGVRYNFVAVDYLIYTHEVVGNIQESYPLAVILTALGLATLPIFFLTRRYLARSFESASTFRQRLVPSVVCLAIPVLSALFVDLSFENITANRFTNELAMNGLYSLVAAFRNNVLDYNRFYTTKDDQVVFDRVKDLVKSDSARFVGTAPYDMTREITNSQPEKRCNVLFVVVESLSAEYLGAFGGKRSLTPNLNALCKESLIFTNFYATGTRTDRGLESITLSVPPTPGRSEVKRPHNEGLFSIGSLFRERGYDTKFIYGGLGYFDNMNAFFEGNGFQSVDQLSMTSDEITFRTIWGVCDEDLYKHVLKQCDLSFDAGKPFCFLALTVSNHRPYAYPPNIDIPSGQSRKGAVKYTDYAIGRLISQAKTKPWFDNTIFVIVADHCASSAGRSEIPVERYHIPLILYAPKIIKPGHVGRLGCQMDVAPTLLGLLNFSYSSKFFGEDLLQPGEGRALLGNYQKIALWRGDKMVVLMPKGKSQTYQVDANGDETECETDETLLLDAVSYYQSASYLLQNRLYTALPAARGGTTAAAAMFGVSRSGGR